MSTRIEQPSAPAAPSTSQSVQDWVANLPAIFAEQQRQAPLEAQQQLDLMKQFGVPLAQAGYDVQKALYPEVTALTEKLATTASQGMDSGLPDWAKQTYQDTYRAQLGDNALSGVGADYMSRGMMQQEKDWRDYYNNLGLTIAGRQPLMQPQAPQTSNYTSQFTPGSVMGYNSTNYGNYSKAYSSMYDTNSQFQTNQNKMWYDLGSSAAAGVGMAMM